MKQPTLKEIKILEEQPYLAKENGTQVIALPEGWATKNLADLRETPARISEVINLTGLDSFIDYVNSFKNHTSIVKASVVGESGLFVESILDYHADSDMEFEPGWTEHRAKFKTTDTPAWQAWAKGNQTWMAQSVFADFLYQNQVEIKSPAGAGLLEVIQTLKASAKGEFRDMKDLHNGSHELVYRMKITAQGGTTEKPLELPQSFEIKLMPFYGGPLVKFNADLLIRTPKEDGEPVMMCYRLYRSADVFHILFEEIVDQLKKETELPVYLC